MTKQKGLVIFSQMTLRVFKLIFWIWLVGIILLNIFKFLYVKIVHFMFDGNFLLNSYDSPFNPLSAVLKKNGFQIQVIGEQDQKAFSIN